MIEDFIKDLQKSIEELSKKHNVSVEQTSFKDDVNKFSLSLEGYDLGDKRRVHAERAYEKLSRIFYEDFYKDFTVEALLNNSYSYSGITFQFEEFYPRGKYYNYLIRNVETNELKKVSSYFIIYALIEYYGRPNE